MDGATKKLLEEERSYVFETRLSMAEKLKEAGNTVFERQKIRDAEILYKRGLYHLDFDEATFLYEFSEKHQKQVKDARVPLHLNLAACYLIQESYLADPSESLFDPKLAYEHSDEALKIDPQNAKGLFRRGQAQRMRGKLKQAKRDLLEAARISPQSAVIRQALEKVTEELRQERKDIDSTWKKRLGGSTSEKHSNDTQNEGPAGDRDLKSGSGKTVDGSQPSLFRKLLREPLFYYVMFVIVAVIYIQIRLFLRNRAMVSEKNSAELEALESWHNEHEQGDFESTHTQN